MSAGTGSTYSVVQHKTDIPFVDAETKRNGSADDLDLPLSPADVETLLLLVANVCVIDSGAYASF